jgi:beta-phosphoglucomutase-like phosphatase (HAD superfamily)
VSTLRALVWDVDGTLAETERDGHRIAFNRAFEDEGLGWHWDVATYGELLAVTGGKERIRHWWQGIDAAAASRPGADAMVRRLHERKTAHYAALVRSGAVVLRPGVQRLLLDARAQGLTLAIATTTTEANVHELLRATLGEAAPGWFGVIGAGDVVARKKPAPDIYRWVLERLELPAHAVIAIEDSAPGAAAAQSAGAPVLLTRGLYSADDVFGPPLLADLDGLGSEHGPARGQACGQPWSGCVDVALLRQWHSLQESSQDVLQR